MTMNYYKKELSIDEVADRLVDAILNETHLNRESLLQLINPHLKIWVNQRKYLSHVKESRVHIQKREFWKRQLQNVIGRAKTKELQDELDMQIATFIANGYDHRLNKNSELIEQ